MTQGPQPAETGHIVQVERLETGLRAAAPVKDSTQSVAWEPHRIVTLRAVPVDMKRRPSLLAPPSPGCKQSAMRNLQSLSNGPLMGCKHA